MKEFFRWRSRGLPMGKINYLMAGVTLLISTLLLTVIYRTDVAYRSMRDTTDEYIHLEMAAYKLQVASDYLTEQVRCFAVTGERAYLDNYFEEANVTRRREQALAILSSYVGESEAYQGLKSAMDDSVALMDREYYSMRLTVESRGYDVTAFPEPVQALALTPEEEALPPEEKADRARHMVFDYIYREQKESISRHIQACLDELSNEMDNKQEYSSTRLRGMLKKERTMILVQIGIMVTIILLTSLLVITPLLKAVLHIRDDQPIPIRGAYEFRFLAQTYNLMYEINRETREQLAYDASHDKLTGLYNRSGYDYLIENTHIDTGALLLVDVDNFKVVNDTYGHDMGDRVLKWVGEVIRRHFRAQDYVCRIGGDEFAIIMTLISPQHSELIREKVRRINEILRAGQDDLPPTSVSVGVAFGAYEHRSRNLYSDADKALYEVKENGRCGCAFYELPNPPAQSMKA